MYNRLYIFLNKNNVIYNLQCGFRQQYSTPHALINITENTRKALDDGNIGCGVFVDLQKAFDTVDHQILLAKLNHYGIRGVSNDWFKSYLSNRNKYVSINGYQSGFAALNCGIPQGSVEAVFQRCSVKKVLLEISHSAQENTCARVSF